MPTDQIYMPTSGPCVRVQSLHNQKSWIVPYTEDVAFTAAQSTRTPIKELITNLQAMAQDATSWLGGSDLGDILAGAQKIASLLGVQFNSKYYYASSWAGSLPSSFTLTMNFYLGCQSLWNANEEVAKPIMDIMSCTVPSDDISPLLIGSPIPSGASVFLAYGASIIEGIFTGGEAIVNFFTGKRNQQRDVTDTSSLASTSIKDDEKNVKNTYTSRDRKSSLTSYVFGKVWEVSFGWYNTSGGANAKFKPFYTFHNLIVENSTLKFSSKVQNDKDQNPTPISGSISLSIKTKGISTSQDFSVKHINTTTDNKTYSGYTTP